VTDLRVRLVHGADPALRDREVQRVVEELLEGEDRTLALEEHEIPGRRRAAADEGAAEPESDGTSLDHPGFGAVVNALQSPPFMTAHRVVVVREIGNLTTDQAKWIAAWIEEAPDDRSDTRLVLVAGGGRTPPALDKAGKARGATVTPRTEQTAGVLDVALKGSGVHLGSDATAHVLAHLGDDAGRVPELVEVLATAYGPGSRLGIDEVDLYLGDLGTAGPFDLTNAIDKGDVAAALEVLHRMLTATSTRAPKPMHPLQVMGMLSRHYQRLLRLDDPFVTTKEQAADVLGMRSAGGARFPLEAAKRLGTSGLREAMQLLARAELDFRGYGGLDERTVIDLLVARLAALTRRHQPGSRSRARR
jgi:DNA polymerase III delta subunit